MSWFRNIARSGLLPADEYQRKRAILLSNYISMLLCACLIVLFIIRRFVFGHIAGGITLSFLGTGFLLFIIPILLNRIHLTTLSRLFLCYAPVLFIWYVYVSLMKDIEVIEQANYDSMRIHLLSVSFIPYLLLNDKKKHLLVFGILPTLLSILLFEWILSRFGVGIHQKGIPNVESDLVGVRTFIAYAVMNTSCFIFQAIITYNDTLNQRIRSELQSKSEQIKSQNEALLRSQERLNEINQHLEELVSKKTEDIKAQNEKILKYAHANAHHVRGPVARLLGLIQLSKLETDLNYPWFFQKVEDAVKEVDDIIIGISHELDEIDQQNTIARPNHGKTDSSSHNASGPDSSDPV